MKSFVPNLVVNDPTYSNQALEIESIYNSATVGLCILDKSLRYLRLNQRYADMNGITVEDQKDCRIPQTSGKTGTVGPSEKGLVGSRK